MKRKVINKHSIKNEIIFLYLREKRKQKFENNYDYRYKKIFVKRFLNYIISDLRSQIRKNKPIMDSVIKTCKFMGLYSIDKHGNKFIDEKYIRFFIDEAMK